MGRRGWIDGSAILARELKMRVKEGQLMSRELELVRRELEIMCNSNLRHSPTPTTPARVEEVETNPRPRVNINSIAELLPPFGGANADFDRWERQLKLLKATYALDDKSTRVLIGSRLKGKALE